MNTGIYKWTSPSGKSYVGQAVDLARRKKEFLTNPFNYTYTSENSAIDRARRKYNDFRKWQYEILEYCTIDELNKKEIEYIANLNTTNSKIGYNSTKGGDGAKGVAWGSPKQIEWAVKLKELMKGENNPNYGKHHTEEAKQKMREARLGTHPSIETLKKISKPVNQYTMDGTFIRTWIGAKQVTKELGINNGSIGKVCQGKKKSAGGYIWRYSE